MRIVGIGAGPAALYFSILMKRAHPESDITLYERNQPDDTFGWGVVFSDETLGGFELADRKTYDEITRRFAYWTDMDTFYGGTCVRSTGHGFCGMSRKELLKVFHRRCRELGVKIEFGHDVTDVEAVRLDADLVLGADGVNSLVRDTYAEHFVPDIDWRKCKFTWLGTTLPLEAFTFIFRENEHGLFQVHAYPFQRDLSTFIVECHEDVWKRAGLDSADEAQTVAYVRELFSDHLEGHELLTNMSVWRTFPTIKNATWHYENVVLMGDAAHTAHFSIGSGTKLAMEDAITLSEAFKEHGTSDVGKVLDIYEESRRVEVIKIQKAAQTSLEWFENSARYMTQHPVQFSFNLMTRSKRITYDNLRVRDPKLVDATAAWFATEARGATAPTPPPTPAFNPLTVGNVELMNRIVVSPMCQYSAVDGTPTDWHFVHYGALAVGGAGLVMSEMTNVSEDARITYGCAGIYNDDHVAAWQRILAFARENSKAKFGLQLGHAGRKGSSMLPWDGDAPIEDGTQWETIGPSALPYAPNWHVPREMTRADMDRVIGEYVGATERAKAAGFDVLEVHMAHGYLLSTFLSPLSNQRTDEYGGDIEGRAKFPLEVFRAVRAAWDGGRPLFTRVTATDWLDAEGGQTIDEAVALAKLLKAAGGDVIDVSSAGNVSESAPEFGRMFQVPFAEQIRHEVGIPVMAVGAILGVDHANTVLAAGRADLCAMARPHLINPHLTLEAAGRYFDPAHPWPKQYFPARPMPKDDEKSLLERLQANKPRIRFARTDPADAE